MNIQGISSFPLTSINTDSAVGVAMMSKALEDSAVAGAEMVQMMDSAPAAALEHSVNPHIGGNIDVSV